MSTPVRVPPFVVDGVRVRRIVNGRAIDADASALAALDWSAFNLVLGAGGATGAAFEAGALLSLCTDVGVDLANAVEMVGTSAGSIGCALAAIGLDPHDLAAVVTRAHEWLSPVAQACNAALAGEAPPMPPMPSMRELLRPLGPLGLLRSGRLAAERRYRALMLHSLRDGSFDLTPHLTAFAAIPWPADRRLTICATDARTGERVALTAADDVPLIDAVAASCAIPAVIHSVRAGNRRLVDGGVVSPTNADLVVDAVRRGNAPTTTLVVSPMSGTGAATSLGRMSSWFARGRIRHELRRAQGDTILIEPAGALGRAVIDDALDQDGLHQIVASTYVGVAGRRAAGTVAA